MWKKEQQRVGVPGIRARKANGTGLCSLEYIWTRALWRALVVDQLTVRAWSGEDDCQLSTLSRVYVDSNSSTVSTAAAGPYLGLLENATTHKIKGLVSGKP